MNRSYFGFIATVVACASFGVGCAGMVVGSSAWFDKKRPDVEPVAASDLPCTGTPIEFKPVTMNDYREVEARGCGKKVRYKLVKIGFVEKWVKAGEVTSS